MLRLRCLVDGKPVPNLTVIVGTQHERDKPVEHSIRTDRDGIVTVSINHPGRWFARFVRMVPASGGGIDYESKWATLTFQVGKAR